MGFPAGPIHLKHKKTHERAPSQTLRKQLFDQTVWSFILEDRGKLGVHEKFINGQSFCPLTKLSGFR